MDAILSHLQIYDLKPICWAEIRQHAQYEERCKFIDGSKGKMDPRFHHLVISPDQIEGYDRHFLVCYFDRDGRWITQTPFDSLREAIDHGRQTFEIEDYEWHWSDPNTPLELKM